MIRTEKRGARIYVLGDTLTAKEQLAAVGCLWDDAARAWWIKPAHAHRLGSILTEHNTRPASPVMESGVAQALADCRTGDELDAAFPVQRSLGTGLWGWERAEDRLNLARCTFSSRGQATRHRNAAWRTARESVDYEPVSRR